MYVAKVMITVIICLVQCGQAIDSKGVPPSVSYLALNTFVAHEISL